MNVTGLVCRKAVAGKVSEVCQRFISASAIRKMPVKVNFRGLHNSVSRSFALVNE